MKNILRTGESSASLSRANWKNSELGSNRFMSYKTVWKNWTAIVSGIRLTALKGCRMMRRVNFHINFFLLNPILIRVKVTSCSYNLSVETLLEKLAWCERNVIIKNYKSLEQYWNCLFLFQTVELYEERIKVRHYIRLVDFLSISDVTRHLGHSSKSSRRESRMSFWKRRKSKIKKDFFSSFQRKFL